MTENEETAYAQGSKAAWNVMLRTCLRELGGDESPELMAGRLLAERTEAIATLRSIAEDGGGDTDWSDDLHLADIIEKHMNFRGLA